MPNGDLPTCFSEPGLPGPCLDPKPCLYSGDRFRFAGRNVASAPVAGAKVHASHTQMGTMHRTQTKPHTHTHTLVGVAWAVATGSTAKVYIIAG